MVVIDISLLEGAALGLLWAIHGLTHWWARITVIRERMVSRTRILLALSTLYLISAATVVRFAYLPPLNLFLNWAYVLIWLSVLCFFPTYTLLKKKLIAERIYILTFLVFLVPGAISFLSANWLARDYSRGVLMGATVFAILFLLLIGTLVRVYK